LRRSLRTVRGEVRRSDEGLVNEGPWLISIAMHARPAMPRDVTTSVSANGGKALCSSPFPQVTADFGSPADPGAAPGMLSEREGEAGNAHLCGRVCGMSGERRSSCSRRPSARALTRAWSMSSRDSSPGLALANNACT
jgi:hypothetical protein